MTYPSTSHTAVFGFPISGVGLDVIKLSAAALMVVDHIDDILLGRGELILYLLGRAVFPLFCFATAAYILRAGPEKAGHYATRLLILAVLAEPISQLTRDIDTANVIFTLAVGGVFAAWLPAQHPVIRHGVFAAAVMLTPLMPEPFEFGLAGAVLPAAILMAFGGQNRSAWIWMIALLFTMNAANAINIYHKGTDPDTILFAATVVGLAAIIFPVFILLIAKEFKVQDIQRRLTPKYFLHVFYPAHLFFLYLVMLMLAG